MIHDHDGLGPHSHEQLQHPGLFHQRAAPRNRDYRERSFTVGIGGPVGSGKTALLLALCRALRDRGVHVPKQLSLMTFDHVDWMRVTEPALTSIGVHGDPLGQAAARALLDRLTGTAGSPRTIELRMELALRDSIAPPVRGGKGASRSGR